MADGGREAAGKKAGCKKEEGISSTARAEALGIVGGFVSM